MMKYSFLLLALLSAVAVYGQQKPAGFHTSVLSKYEYQGWEIHKGDQVALQNEDTLTVKEIQKYEDRYGWTYYIVGKNKAGTTAYYPIPGALKSGTVKAPGHIDIDGKAGITYGILPVQDNQVVYEQTGTAPSVPEAVLYDNALSHLARTYNNSKAAMRVNDKEMGHIIIPGSYSLSYGSPVSLTGAKEIQVTYLCDIQVKPGKYRLRLHDFRLELFSVNQKWESYPVFLGNISNSKSQKDIDFTNAFNGNNMAIIDALARAMEKAPDNDW